MFYHLQLFIRKSLLAHLRMEITHSVTKTILKNASEPEKHQLYYCEKAHSGKQLSHIIYLATRYSVHLQPFLTEWGRPYICSKIIFEPSKEISELLNQRGAQQPSHVGNLLSSEWIIIPKDCVFWTWGCSSELLESHICPRNSQALNMGGGSLLNVISLF